MQDTVFQWKRTSHLRKNNVSFDGNRPEKYIKYVSFRQITEASEKNGKIWYNDTRADSAGFFRRLCLPHIRNAYYRIMNTDERMGKTESNHKLIHLEILRIFAVFWVIFNHTNEKGFFLFSTRPDGGAAFWIDLFISVFCKFGVPVFFAISGALLLNRKPEPLKTLWSRRILKMVIILLIFSVAYYLFDTLHLYGDALDWKDFLLRFYSSELKPPLWFMYAYIAFLVILPFLQAMVERLADKHFYYLFVMAVVINGVIPALEYLFFKGQVTLNENFSVSSFLSTIVLYPCLGYFMQNRLEKKQCTGFLPVLWILNVAGIAASCLLTYLAGRNDGFYTEAGSQTFFSIFVVLNCAAVFLTGRVLFEGRQMAPCIRKVLLTAGSCTFGIYLLHSFVFGFSIYEKALDWAYAVGLNKMIAVLLMCFLIFLVTFFLTWLLSKIPVVKKAVGF